MGSRGMKRELIIELETSGLTSETGEIIRYRAINHWEDTYEFDEWAGPLVAMKPDAQRIVGVTHEQLASCRPSAVVKEEFVGFIDRAPN